MGKRVSNKKGIHQGARCGPRLGWRKQRVLEHLKRQRAQLQLSKEEGASKILTQIRGAIRKILPTQHERRHQGR